MALEAGRVRFTYSELERTTARLAERIAPELKQSNLVGILFDKGWEQVVAALAILRAGGAYVLFEKANVFGKPNLTRIDFKNDVGFVVNGGVSFRLTRMLALTADGKYVPVKSSATAVYTNGTTTTKVKINPVIFSGGLSLRF